MACFVLNFVLTFRPLTPYYPDGNEETKNWPVHERCKSSLEGLLSMHVVVPLPAYDIKGTLIPPDQYSRQLPGAIVQVHFAIQHCFIKKDKNQTFFTTYVREINVLRAAGPPPTSPMKKQRVADGPLTMCCKTASSPSPSKRSKKT